jgi:hypothetical protein
MTSLSDIPIVDGHLDLAENVTLFGRDLTLDVDEIRAREQRHANEATVSLPELERGGIAVALATVTPGFLAEDVGSDFEPRSALYRTAEEAEANALAQIALYERWEREGRVRLMRSAGDLEDHLQQWRTDKKVVLAGWEVVGIGSDLDGGFGRMESPLEIDTIAGLYKIGDVVPDKAREAVLGGNWLRFLRRSLPRRSG